MGHTIAYKWLASWTFGRKFGSSNRRQGKDVSKITAAILSPSELSYKMRTFVTGKIRLRKERVGLSTHPCLSRLRKISRKNFITTFRVKSAFLYVISHLPRLRKNEVADTSCPWLPLWFCLKTVLVLIVIN